MRYGIVKPILLKMVSLGLKVPQIPIDRLTELIRIKEFLKLLNINCVLDVGANRGQFAHDLRGVGYDGYIISFEPIENEFSVLSQSFKDDVKWRGYQLALGSENKILPINVSRLTVMSSFLKSVHEPYVESQEVEIKRLDALFPELVKDIPNPQTFLKMDTQGYDLEVFKGATGCVEEIVGLQSELSVQPLYEDMPLYLEALEKYESLGFKLYNLSVVNRVASGGLLELNALMRRL
jgi:FkbM family methyltransferase